jgi:hypothetical protein
MRLGRGSSESGACTWDGAWRNYDSSITGFDLKGGGDAGPRWVCAVFRNADLRESPVVRDRVTFDHAPLANNDVWFNRSSKCTGGDMEFDLLGFAPYAATDKDGVGTLSVTRVWYGGSTFPGTVNLSDGISGDFKKVTIHFENLAGSGDLVYRFYFTVEDTYHLKDSSYFEVKFFGC